MSPTSEKFTQDERLLDIESPLGSNKLLLRSFSGHESLSQLFRYQLDLISHDRFIDFSKIVGQRITVGIRLPGDKTKRFFNGFVSRFAQMSHDGQFAHYQAEMVPWLWFLSRSADCRIFQDKTVEQIITAVLKQFSPADFAFRLNGQHKSWEYCVQYRESALNFVTRLMEQEGIFYFFEHDEKTHKLIMSDSTTVHKPCPNQAKVKYQPWGGVGMTRLAETIASWRNEQELRTGKCALKDFNFETPSNGLFSSIESRFKVAGNSQYEIFDFPGEYEERAEGDNWVKLRMEEEEAAHTIISGDSDCRSLISGFYFDLTGHDREDQNGSYVLTSIFHKAVEPAFHPGIPNNSSNYSNTFACIPLATPFRPSRTTPRPLIQGAQTAIVMGPSGEEIYTDKYGRVKVKFHWDRQDRKGEERSCWIRVSQPWAGKNWGSINIPRVGQEVIVEFLEGDPDRPIITGRVYNDEQMPPYKLADNQTRTTFMSRSTKGGTSSNYNEIRFEDKKGGEQIFMNAEKDMDLRVENDSREFVGKDRSLIVKGDQKEKVEGSLHGETAGSRNEKVGRTMSLQVGQNLEEKSGQNYAHEAGMEIHLKAGMNVVIEAGMQLTIKASGGFINIGPAGIAISGTLVLINSGGAAGAGSGSSPQDPQKPDEADDGSKGGKM